MDTKKLQNVHKFFNRSRKLWNFNKFLSPAQNSWKYRKFLPTKQIWPKFHKFFSPHKIEKNFKSFCPHKFEKILQIFVPGTNRENFYKFLSLWQNWETKFFDLKNVPHGSSRVGTSPPVTKREFGLTTKVDL